MLVTRSSEKIGAQDVQAGNMVVVIGAVSGAVATTLTGTSVRWLTVTADWFHVWRTQDNAIDDFPSPANAWYWPLSQQTSCAIGPHGVLSIS